MSDKLASDQKSPSAPTKPVRVRRAVVAASAGVITLGADDFAQFAECMSQTKKPTTAMVEAAMFHRSLTGR